MSTAVNQWRYALGAGIADYYVLSTLCRALWATWIGATKRAVPPLAVVGPVGVMVVALIAYHALLTRWMPFRTPGECMMGRRWVVGEKRWTNPYAIGRAGLFVVTFLTLIGLSNTFGDTTDDIRWVRWTTVSVLGVLWGLAVASLVILSLSAIGVGRTKGGFFVVAYWVLASLQGFVIKAPAGVEPNLMRGIVVLYLAAAVAAALILGRYRRAALTCDVARLDPPSLLDVSERT